MRKEEKQRLEREEQEAKGFVPNLERLLIAVDDSPNGKFASRVAGMLAGTHGMPTTVLHITDAEQDRRPEAGKQGRPAAAKPRKAKSKAGEKKADERSRKRKTRKEAKPAKDKRKAEQSRRRKKAEIAGETVKEAAEQIKSKQKDEEKADAPVEVTTIVHEAPSPTDHRRGSREGLRPDDRSGSKRPRRAASEFHDSVTKLALGFNGPLAITATRGDLEKKPDGKLSILVPVNGTEAARRGAEVAITIARATKAPLTVLYVAARADGKRLRRGLRTRRTRKPSSRTSSPLPTATT